MTLRNISSKRFDSTTCGQIKPYLHSASNLDPRHAFFLSIALACAICLRFSASRVLLDQRELYGHRQA
jgi:hypothetical protein